MISFSDRALTIVTDKQRESILSLHKRYDVADIDVFTDFDLKAGSLMVTFKPIGATDNLNMGVSPEGEISS